MEKYTFEEVPITIMSHKEIRNFFSSLKDDEKKYISFINPEILMFQQKNREMHDYFLQSSVNFIDGGNILYAINRFWGTKYTQSARMPGTDFFEYLSPDQTYTVFLYGAQKENCVLAKENIESRYRNVTVVGYIDGYAAVSDKEIVESINAKKADIVIVCLGCPKQELWVRRNLDTIEAKLVFGNGGAIDFWSGKTKRCPQFMISLSLEWLFRLFASFSWARVKRQSKLIIFLIKYMLKRYDIRQIS